MPTLTIKTADELIALDLEGRWRTRRAGRETAVSRWILQAFLDRGGPIPVEHVVAAFPESPADRIHRAVVVLDDDDLIRIADDQIDIAYPFSVSPTPFAIRLPNGSDRYACCAMDALGIAHRHPADDGAVELAAHQIGVGELRAFEIGADQGRGHQVGVGEVAEHELASIEPARRPIDGPSP